MLSSLQTFLINYPLLAPIVFILVRSIPIVILPIPGVLVDFVGIAVFGWAYGMVLGQLGVLLGSVVAFLVARYLREPVVEKLVPLEKLDEWEARLSGRRKFWTLVGLRVISSPYFDYVNYAAGLTRINLSLYVAATFVGITPMMFVIYYFGGLSLSGGWKVALVALSLLVLIPLLTQAKTSQTK